MELCCAENNNSGRIKMQNIKLLSKFYLVLLKSKMEYRLNFALEIGINIFTYLVTYLGTWVILNKFHTINGWNLYEVMILYNMNLVTYGIACLFFYIPFRNLENILVNGEFDSYLTKPVNPFIYLILRQNYLGFLSHIVLGMIMFSLCLQKVEIDWSMSRIFAFISAITGGTLIQASIIIATGALNIKLVRANALMDAFIYNVRSFVEYPIDLYPTFIQCVVTFIIPYALINYYPAAYIFRKTTTFCVALPLVIGGLMFAGAYALFMYLLRYYQGTGT